MKKIFCFDLDNTLCSTYKKFYHRAKPKKEAIKLVNSLYDKGYYIKIFTGRYMGRSKDNISKAYNIGYKFTNKQLLKWGLKYHKLILGKPSFDYFVDDKSYGFNSNWIKYFKKKFL